MSYLKQLPVQLLITVLCALILGPISGPIPVSFFYTVSCCFIEILLFILPFMVFIFIFRALSNLRAGSLYLVLLIFLGVTVSNCIALLIAYCFGSVFLSLVNLQYCCDFAEKFCSEIKPLFSLELPHYIGTDKAMILGLISGTGINFIKDTSLIRKKTLFIFNMLSEGIMVFLKKIFIPLLPVYVFGFCLKLSYDQALVHLFEQYGKVFVGSLILIFLYLFLLYLLGSAGNLRETWKNLKIMIPAGLTGFSTMSSAATMPVTLECTHETTKDPHFTDLIIPSTANIHMLGDDLTIMMTALSLLIIAGQPQPDFLTLISFILAFSLAKLSCVGVPGASVLVILPVLKGFLGFTPDMISVLTTIYILQDPFGTSANVMGNGAFALIIQRLFKMNFFKENKK
jgi:Na+/H+-dicarboxylate symporter